MKEVVGTGGLVDRTHPRGAGDWIGGELEHGRHVELQDHVLAHAPRPLEELRDLGDRFAARCNIGVFDERDSRDRSFQPWRARSCPHPAAHR